MIRLAANLDVRWCRSLPVDCGFLNPGGAHNTPVQAESDLSAALLEPAGPLVEKLAYKSILPHTSTIRTRGTPLRSRSRLHIRQLFGRWRIFWSLPHLRSPYGTIPPSRRRDHIASGLPLDKT